MAKILLTVSGRIASPEVIDNIGRGLSRRIDYLEMAQAFDAELIDFEAARQAGPISRLIARYFGNKVALAWTCFRRRREYQVIFTDGEGIGLPLATMLKYLAPFARQRPHLLMIGHDVLSARKRPFYQLLRVHTHIDYHFVFNQTHWNELHGEWRIPKERVVRIHFMVDPDFFSAAKIQPGRHRSGRPKICAVGIEARDYPTLMRAADGLDVEVVIAASSPWSHQADSSKTMAPPPNVIINRDPKLDVRQLYADSNFVVMPLFDVDRAAGSTTILEAMAMGKAIICSRALGQRDLVVDGETGIYVPPGDVGAMRKAIQYLLEHPEEATRMGSAGRRRIEQEMSIDHYVAHMGAYVQRCLDERRPFAAPANPAHGD